MARFIRQKFEVQDPEESKIYKQDSQEYRQEFDLSGLNIFFTGLRGSGKSTLGKRVAKGLQAQFVDTDEKVVEQAGQSIARIVADKGWEAFRELEHKVLKKVSSENGQVIATGGGIVLRDDNRELMQDRGQIFYLMAHVPELLARLENSPETEQRPALSQKSLQEELAETLGQREHLYVSIADHVLQAEKSPEELAEDVYQALGLKDGIKG